MLFRNSLVRFTFLTILMSTSALQSLAQETAVDDGDDAEQLIDSEVVSIMDSFTTLITSADRFSVSTDMGYEAVQSDGRKLEFGSTRESTIKRPDKAKFDFTSRNGRHGVMILDGEQVSVHSPEDHVYATSPQVGDLDEALESITDTLGIENPLADLFASDVHDRLVTELTEADYVDRELIQDVWCDHLTLSTDFVDVEIWIAEGDRPLPQRVIITYKNSPGEPRFWAQFLEWDLSPSLSENTFSFVPPDGYERVRFKASISPVKSEGENP
jgi:hypothetical protein